MSLTEIARETGIPPSSCYALVKTLVHQGYIYYTDDSKHLYPTRRIASIAESVLHNDQSVRTISSIVQELVSATGETSIIGKLQGDKAIYLNVLEGKHMVRFAAAPGDQHPAHASCIGKAGLSMLPPSDFIRLLDKIDLTKETSTTITDRKAIEEDILESKRRGYFLSLGEAVEDVMGIAVACRTSSGNFGVSISGPSSRLESKFESYFSSLLAVKQKIQNTV